MSAAVALAGPDAAVVAGLRAGDADVFDALVTRYHSSFVHVAQSIVRDRCIAEDVAQETWLAVLNAIDGFEQRSSLQTWLYRIVANIARGRVRVERRMVPFSRLERDADVDGDEQPFAECQRPGTWAWRSTREYREDDPIAWLEDCEVRAALAAALETLPARQRAVVQLRDVEGFSSEEVSSLLDISAGNQRVLLHRARTKLRTALVDYVSTVAGSGSMVGIDADRAGDRTMATTTPTANQAATI
jgi:RNA polymerase sigma-70 factor, ECF subfamily